VTNVNVTNVTIVAPATATASGRAFNGAVPAAAPLAAARPALVQARAPAPASTRPVVAYGAPPPGANTYAARNAPHEPLPATEALPRSGMGQPPPHPATAYPAVAPLPAVQSHASTPAPAPRAGVPLRPSVPANAPRAAVSPHPTAAYGNGGKPAPHADNGRPPKKPDRNDPGQQR